MSADLYRQANGADDPEPAFPRTRQGIAGETVFEAYGMTLRDYFAAKALSGLCASFSDWDAREHVLQNAIAAERGVKEQVAFAAYEYADAMLAERAK